MLIARYLVNKGSTSAVAYRLDNLRNAPFLSVARINAMMLPQKTISPAM